MTHVRHVSVVQIKPEAARVASRSGKYDGCIMLGPSVDVRLWSGIPEVWVDSDSDMGWTSDYRRCLHLSKADALTSSSLSSLFSPDQPLIEQPCLPDGLLK
jgi:hypothetical protein